MTGTAIFTANRGYALSNSRKDLIRAFIRAGWAVVLATANDVEARALERLGAHLEPVEFDRGGLMLAADLGAYRRMLKVCRAWQPTLLHNFNAKPCIAGTLAAWRVMQGDVRIFNTITGLGHAFVSGGVTARLAGLGYRLSLSRSAFTIFQNSDDRAMFVGRNWVPENRARLIAGSGVDVQRFAETSRAGRDPDSPTVVLAARLIRQKGIPEFVAVAERVRQRWPKARFLIAGEEDPVHPDAVSTEWLRGCNGVEYLGKVADMNSFFAQADLFLFPSYREGMPRVVMEAAATGLPTVAFDVPGVREAVRHGETGYLCPDRNVDALVQRVSELLENPEQRLAMGNAARRLAERAFDIRAVQEQYLALYREAGVSV